MSAIVGILSTKKEYVNEGVLKNMQQTLKHRGHDALGYDILEFTNNRYSFCGIASNQKFFKRIKYSPQPIWNSEHSVSILFDGEIYSTDLDYNVDKISDSEFILNLYLKYGINEMFNHLNGVWSLCIIDKRVSKVYLIRDKLGEKPLYIYNTPELLMFASEYKSFYCHPNFKSILNEDAVSEYFVFRYACGESTFLKNVINLEPGCFLEISGDNIEKKRYYQLPVYKSNNKNKEYNKKVLERKIYKAVKERLLNIDNIGAQLSGGVDSSYICSIIKKIRNKTFSTYSITFDGYSEDESEYVDFVNNYLDLESYKFNSNPINFLNSWEKSTYHFEAPMNHEGTIPLFDLNKIASENVDVLFCGDGPDESMGGYPIFRRIDCFYRDLCGLRWLGVKIKALLKKKRHFSSREEHYISLHQFIKDEYVKKLRPYSYKKDIQYAFYKRMEIMKRFEKNDYLHKLTNFDLVTFGLECTMRTEKMGMSEGITIRSPFLSIDLQEFLLTVPSRFLTDYKKIYYKSTKILLKELCADDFGEKFTYRPKFGLGVPNHEIFANREVRKYIEEKILPSLKKRNIVDYEFINKIWQLPLTDKNSYDPGLLQVMWVVFSFEIWAIMYLDNNPLLFFNKK